jgi:hypothetical protein
VRATPKSWQVLKQSAWLVFGLHMVDSLLYMVYPFSIRSTLFNSLVPATGNCTAQTEFEHAASSQQQQ